MCIYIYIYVLACEYIYIYIYIYRVDWRGRPSGSSAPYPPHPCCLAGRRSCALMAGSAGRATTDLYYRCY